VDAAPSRLVVLIAAALAAAYSSRAPPPPPGDKAPAPVARLSFPDLPRTPEAAADLVQRETRRSIDPAREVDAAAILAAVAARPGTVVAGEVAVARWVQAFLDRAGGDAYVLFGTWHDAPGQIDAFRRLIGPQGLTGLTVVAVELFRADGAWGGAPAEAQRGDGEAIDGYVSGGDRQAFARLAESHRDADYVAWKLGYESTALDLLVTARAQGLRFLGCDMPRALQDLSAAPPGELRHRLREIHCVHALPPAPASGRRRVALLWGDAHLRPAGIRRFLPKEAAVLAIHALGQRMEAGPIEGALAKDLVAVEPALVPIGPDEAALLLPDERLGGRVDRVAAGPDPGEIVRPGLAVHAGVSGVVVVGDREVSFSPEGAEIALPDGDHTYVLSAGGKRWVGALRMAAGHRVELSLDVGAGLLGYLDRSR
jgi:hypothetical protein